MDPLSSSWARPATPPSGLAAAVAAPPPPPASSSAASTSAASPSSPSRSLSRGLSLHQLGITPSPLSPLRQFLRDTSGDTDNDDVGEPDDDLTTDDSRDVLVDRLNDLVRHLTSQPTVAVSARAVYLHDDHVLSALHSRVDEMESVLAAAAAAEAAQVAAASHQPLLPASPSRRRQPVLQAAARIVPSLPPRRQPRQLPPVASPASRQIAAECNSLADDLSASLVHLTERTEEFEHIQNLLRLQLAAAVDRAAGLEARVTSLTTALAAATADQREERESELAFLRLQLRAIEAQCRPYVPRDADPELAESIANWKADWAALQHRITEERTHMSGVDNV